MPDLQGLPDSYALGVCGLTGYTFIYNIYCILRV